MLSRKNLTYYERMVSANNSPHAFEHVSFEVFNINFDNIDVHGMASFVLIKTGRLNLDLWRTLS